MAKGPRGEKRPADVNARAVMIAKIATGEIEERSCFKAVDMDSVQSVDDAESLSIRPIVLPREFP